MHPRTRLETPPSIVYAEGRALNNQGQVAMLGWDAAADREDLLLWPSVERIAPPEGASRLWANAISDTGYVSGEVGFNDGTTHAFRWSPANDLEIFDDRPATATTVNDAGLVAGLLGGTSPEYFTWDGETVERLLPRVRNEHGAVWGPGGVMAGPNSVPVMLDTRVEDMRVNSVWQRTAVELVEQIDGTNIYNLLRLDPLRIAGDYNASGTVDQGDLDLVLAYWGSDELPDAWVHDFPDGLIDQTELDKVLVRWGRSDGVPFLPLSRATDLSIPEPMTFTLTIIGLASLRRLRLIS